MAYLIQYFTHGQDRFGTALFSAENDQAAIQHAHENLHSWIGWGHEIWDGDRLVHRELYAELTSTTGADRLLM